MKLKYFYAALSFSLGVAFVAVLVSLFVFWFPAFSAGDRNDAALFGALSFIGTPIGMAAVGFRWGAASVQLGQCTPLALFLVGLLFSIFLLPIVVVLFFVLFLLGLDESDPSLWGSLLIGGVAAAASFFCAFVFNRLEKS